jgi:Zn-dependent peptidase ImmA (M78 family)
MWIKETVEKLTKKYKTNNPFEIAEAMNINVYQRDLHNEIMGFYKYIRRNKFIFINSNLDSYNQVFTCAHELGHSQLHPRINTPFLRSKTFLSVDKIEQEANRFAVELLLPDECIYDYVSTNITIKEIAATYGIPEQICHLKNFTQLLGN